MIYFVQCVRGFIKIGTTVRLTSRLPQLEKDAGCKLTLLGVLGGSFVEEYALHQKFASIRVNGEWFLPADELFAFIRENVSVWDGTDEAPDPGEGYTTIKVDADVVSIARAAAAKNKQRMQDWVSDLINKYGSPQIGSEPIRRRPLAPAKKRGRHKKRRSSD